jgi:hypothetical protein
MGAKLRLGPIVVPYSLSYSSALSKPKGLGCGTLGEDDVVVLQLNVEVVQCEGFRVLASDDAAAIDETSGMRRP